LLKGKRATAVYTSGVYAPGVPPAFGTDHHATYFDDWLRFIGIEDIAALRFQPNLLTHDAAGGLARAMAEAAARGAR
jgi:FMN-dependent NADH-azoreductase